MGSISAQFCCIASQGFFSRSWVPSFLPQAHITVVTRATSLRARTMPCPRLAGEESSARGGGAPPVLGGLGSRRRSINHAAFPHSRRRSSTCAVCFVRLAGEEPCLRLMASAHVEEPRSCLASSPVPGRNAQTSSMVVSSGFQCFENDTHSFHPHA